MAKTKGSRRVSAGRSARNTTAAKPARRAKTARKASRPKARRMAAPVRKRTVKKLKRPAKKAPSRATRASAAKRGANAAKKAAKKAVKRTIPTKATARAKAPVRPVSKAPAPSPRPVSTSKAPALRQRRAPTLDRERRVVTEAELPPSPPSSLNLDRSASAARSGRADFVQKLHKHTSAGPVLTGGDVDADWESAESSGDETPGGNNPTPDQDVVDDIGKALGVEYDDDEELQGGEEIVERDRNRWELDPASRDDFEDE